MQKPQTFELNQDYIRNKIEKFLIELDQFDGRNSGNFAGIESHLFYWRLYERREYYIRYTICMRRFREIKKKEFYKKLKLSESFKTKA